MQQEKECQKEESKLKQNAKLTVAGAAMSATNVSLGHPLDTIKVRSQKDNIPFSDAASKVYREGGIKGLYKGVVPNVCRNTVNTTWRVPLTTHGPQVFANAFDMNDSKGKPSFEANIAASFLLTGPVDIALSSVFEVSKVNQQTGGTYGTLYKSFLEKGGGPKAFASTYMKGMTSMYMKSAVGYSALFSINKLDKKINKQLNPDGESSWLTVPISAAVASGIKVAITNPFDVIKTHKQAAGSNAETSTLGTAAKILRENGAKAFYRGMESRFAHGYLAAQSGMVIMKLSEQLEDKHERLLKQDKSYAKTITDERKEEKYQNITR